MIEKALGLPARPALRPKNPKFSSGPCRKHPGWDITHLKTEYLGRSHRAKLPKQRLQKLIERSHALLDLPKDWKLGIVPASDTGAFEIAMWNLLGSLPVDALVWESFSNDWAKDLRELEIKQLNIFRAEYGHLPDLNQTNSDHDLVLVFNGTTSGVCVPDLLWVNSPRKGLVLCDATSAAFAVPIDFSKLDVVTWSWQKVLGSEGAHGMLALSPKAINRLETTIASRPIPKIFQLRKDGKLNDGIFNGLTINTPSMLAVEDMHSALDWAESIGGLETLWLRTRSNFQCIDDWVQKTSWIAWLAIEPATRSPTSMCLKIIDDQFVGFSDDKQKNFLQKMINLLEKENIAFDISNYRSAPLGFRIWGGSTVDKNDLYALTLWLDWVFSVCSKFEEK